MTLDNVASHREGPTTGRSWGVINNAQELRFRLHPEFFISSRPEGLEGLAIAARMADRDPQYAQEILRSLYHEYGPSDDFMNDFKKFQALSYGALPSALQNYFSEHNTPLLERPGLLIKALDTLKRESAAVVRRFDRIVFRADPFCAMARAAVAPVDYGDSVEIDSDITYDDRDRWTPDSIPEGKGLNEWIEGEMLRETKGSQFKLTDSARRIRETVTKGDVSLFTRPSLELVMSKERMREEVYGNLRQETKADSEILADVLDVYRTALTYIATGGSNSYPMLDHWRELRKTGKKDYRDGYQQLGKSPAFDSVFAGVLKHHQGDAEKASILVARALSPIMARMIEEKAQFINETFPLHPGKIIWFDDNKKKIVSLPERLREELEKQRKVSFTGELEQAQHKQVIEQGEILLDILGDCQKLFGDVKPEAMAAMYPLLTDGSLTADRQTTSLALSQAAQSSDAIAGNLDRTFAAKVEFSVPEGADDLLQELARTLGKEIGFEYTSLGIEKKVKIPGVEMYRLLQDKSTPDILKRKIASFAFRKFVGYPPDLNKNPDILGELDATRRQELIEYRSRIPASDPFFDIIADKDFRPAEAKKITRLRLKLVHPDVNKDSETKREATFLYNEIMAYMDVLEQERGQGIWASMKDI
ncbi:MAG: hypothetical protein UY10_C0032G0004 [Microgenomates group bacterium GW2011_GWA2_47_8]|nr:MAG: hypothetical protein UY10_C0032G0004 [Microgenomates group bacterium GW2011_GWA2_47_8]